MFLTREHRLEISAAAVRENLGFVRGRLGDRKLIAVVKDEAYGHGMVPVATALAGGGVTRFAVGDVESAVRLLDAGLTEDVLNLRLFAEDEAETVVARGIAQAVFTGDQVGALQSAARRLGRRASVQVKVDTGMGRFGAAPAEAVALIRQLRDHEAFELEGVFTPLAEDPASDDEQAGRFLALREEVGRREGELWHLASSASLLARPDDPFDAARVGCLLDGFSPFVRRDPPPGAAPDLRETVRLAARVIRRVDYRPGDHAGFGPGFREERRGVWIDIGMRHGLLLRAETRADVLIRGRRHRAIRPGGEYAVCELAPGAEAEVGDVAVLIGADGDARIGIREWAGRLGESPYTALIRHLNHRVRRVLVE